MIVVALIVLAFCVVFYAGILIGRGARRNDDEMKAWARKYFGDGGVD